MGGVAAGAAAVVVEDGVVVASELVAVVAVLMALDAVTAGNAATVAVGVAVAVEAVFAVARLGADAVGVATVGVVAVAAVGTLGALPATFTPGALEAAVAGAVAGAAAGVEVLGLATVVVLSLFRSEMFLDNSATRVALSLACFSLARASSLALAATEPLLRVSLSGAAALALGSVTLAWTLPPAARLGASATAVGAPEARRRRNSLKSLDCATIVSLA